MIRLLLVRLCHSLHLASVHAAPWVENSLQGKRSMFWSAPVSPLVQELLTTKDKLVAAKEEVVAAKTAEATASLSAQHFQRVAQDHVLEIFSLRGSLDLRMVMEFYEEKVPADDRASKWRDVLKLYPELSVCLIQAVFRRPSTGSTEKDKERVVSFMTNLYSTLSSKIHQAKHPSTFDSEKKVLVISGLDPNEMDVMACLCKNAAYPFKVVHHDGRSAGQPPP